MAQTDQLETTADRDARLAREEQLLEEGEADYAAGRYLGGPALREWLDAFVAGSELPSPDALRAKYASLKATEDQ